jgi:gluconokinase
LNPFVVAMSVTGSIRREDEGGQPRPHEIPLLIVAGPAGCGKSTIGRAISAKINVPFIEGDDLHPPENLTKMSSGVPLTDADRWPWLDRIVSASRDLEREAPVTGIVVTCSVLKRVYRDHLRQRTAEARLKGSSLLPYFLFCTLSLDESVRRVRRRRGHYMKADMVASQFHDLQVPDPAEEERVYLLGVEKSMLEVTLEAIVYAASVGGGLDKE